MHWTDEHYYRSTRRFCCTEMVKLEGFKYNGEVHDVIDNYQYYHNVQL